MECIWRGDDLWSDYYPLDCNKHSSSTASCRCCSGRFYEVGCSERSNHHRDPFRREFFPLLFQPEFAQNHFSCYHASVLLQVEKIKDLVDSLYIRTSLVSHSTVLNSSHSMGSSKYLQATVSDVSSINSELNGDKVGEHDSVEIPIPVIYRR